MLQFPKVGNYLSLKINQIKITIKEKNKNTASPIKIGDNIHYHDQLIHPVNFNVIKTIVSNPQKPMPPELLDEDEFIYLF